MKLNRPLFAVSLVRFGPYQLPLSLVCCFATSLFLATLFVHLTALLKGFLLLCYSFLSLPRLYFFCIPFSSSPSLWIFSCLCFVDNASSRVGFSSTLLPIDEKDKRSGTVFILPRPSCCLLFQVCLCLVLLSSLVFYVSSLSSDSSFCFGAESSCLFLSTVSALTHLAPPSRFRFLRCLSVVICQVKVALFLVFLVRHSCPFSPISFLLSLQNPTAISFNGHQQERRRRPSLSFLLQVIFSSSSLVVTALFSRWLQLASSPDCSLLELPLFTCTPHVRYRFSLHCSSSQLQLVRT
jgi:hypothetical protein